MSENEEAAHTQPGCKGSRGTVACAALGALIGFLIGGLLFDVRDKGRFAGIRHDLVLDGFAEWAADEDGKPVFRMRTELLPSKDSPLAPPPVQDEEP